MKVVKVQSLTLLSALFLICLQLNVVNAQSNSFTYQGRFTDGGVAATGTYDMRFKLFDSGGTQVGSTITNGSVAVESGVFTVQLDYGNGAFPGADRYLEIAVRPAGSGDPYTVLSPQIFLTSTPYAIHSQTATNATQLNGTAANQFVLTNDPRLTDNRTPSAGSSNYIQNTTTPQANANFNIAGNGTAATLNAVVINANQYNSNQNRLIFANASNVFLGWETGKVNTGTQNTFLGWSTGRDNTIGLGNTFVGAFTGLRNTGGNGNTFVGSAVGDKNTTGDNNTFVGNESGRANVDGNQNSFFGAYSGNSNVSGSGNSFFGVLAGQRNTASSNSFFGTEAGEFNTIGLSNSYFGYHAGSQNITGSLNSFFGSFAGEQNSGESNSFFGASSGLKNTSGKFNSFFGAGAGLSTTTGSNNSFFGSDAGNQNLTASDNAFFGYQAGHISTGATNAFFGSTAGSQNATGFANAFFGMGAGGLNSGGFNNTYLGRGAGAANISGNSNTIVGSFADVDASDLTFATAIGSGAHVNASNTIVLGRSNANDTVRVPGPLTLITLGSGGISSLCRNPLNQVSNCSSSLRYKKDLAPFTRGLALLNTLKPITFSWKSDNSRDLGFGAEDIAAVEPLLVTRNERGEVEGVKYDRITAVLVNAVKEQQVQIQLQQEQIVELRKLVCKQNRRAKACK